MGNVYDNVYTEYFIILNNFEIFTIKLYDTARPTKLDDKQIIKDYMDINYPGVFYKTIDIWNDMYRTVVIE